MTDDDHALLELARHMTGAERAERVELVARLAEAERAGICAGVRSRHPSTATSRSSR